MNKYVAYSIVITITGSLLACTPTPRSPEMLARSVVNTLKTGNTSSFLELCDTSEIQIEHIINSTAPQHIKDKAINCTSSEKQDIDTFLESERTENFERIHKKIDWKSAQIESIEFGESDELHGLKGYDHIYVKLTDGQVLEIDVVVETSKGWLICDDYPLSLE